MQIDDISKLPERYQKQIMAKIAERERGKPTPAERPKTGKYRNVKTEENGIKFDSKKEANRYSELLLLERAGAITNLELQVPFELIPNQKINGKVVERACKYVADFCYIENGQRVVEDTKGFRTAEYIIKRKLMLYVHGIRIKEV